MIGKIKYHSSDADRQRRIRVKCLAVMTAVTIAAVTLLGFSINTVKIFDGEKTYIVRTLSNNVASVLSNLNLKSERYNIMKTSVTARLTTVEIAYSFPVYITKSNETVEIEFTKGTVGDALSLAGFTVDEHDFVEPSVDTVISDTSYIDYTDINYVDGSYTEAIPHSVKTVYASNMAKGTSSLKEGSDGLQLISYTDKLVNGASVEKTITGTTVLTAAVDGEKVVGTKVEPVAVKTSASVKCISTLTPSSPIELDANGVPVSYSSKMTVRATAYTYTGHNCSTGVAPQPGYIAVNPNVIPYGTRMYIKTADGRFIYGYAVAADTGGFIRNHPTGIDLFMTSESACSNFGVRNVEIYILG